MDINDLDYWDCLRHAHQSEWNVNHAGWILHEDETVKYTLDTLDDGESFRIAHWTPGKLTGRVVREVEAPPEIKFLFTLRVG